MYEKMHSLKKTDDFCVKQIFIHRILIIIGWRRYKGMTFYAEKKIETSLSNRMLYLRADILDIKFIVGSEDLKTQLRVLGSVISTNYCLLSIVWMNRIQC